MCACTPVHSAGYGLGLRSSVSVFLYLLFFWCKQQQHQTPSSHHTLRFHHTPRHHHDQPPQSPHYECFNDAFTTMPQLSPSKLAYFHRSEHHNHDVSTTTTFRDQRERGEVPMNGGASWGTLPQIVLGAPLRGKWGHFQWKTLTRAGPAHWFEFMRQ